MLSHFIRPYCSLLLQPSVPNTQQILTSRIPPGPRQHTVCQEELKGWCEAEAQRPKAVTIAALFKANSSRLQKPLRPYAEGV